MKKILKELFSDGAGVLSSKRVVTIICVLMLTIGFFVSLFTNYTVEEFIYSNVTYIVLTGIGVTGAENITNFIKDKLTKSDENG